MLSYLILFFEYLKTRGKGVIGNIFVALLFSTFFYYLNVKTTEAITFSSNAINLLGILLGFTISLFAVILSVENELIKKAKNEKIKSKFYKTEFSLFDCLIINIAFVIILLSILLIFNFLFPLIFIKVFSSYLIYFVIDIGIIIFAILELVNSILNYYFLVTKND